MTLAEVTCRERFVIPSRPDPEGWGPRTFIKQRNPIAILDSTEQRKPSPSEPEPPLVLRLRVVQLCNGETFDELDSTEVIPFDKWQP